MNVGTLHARVTSTGPSLASKDHSHEQSVIPAILKRGYYHPQVNSGPCQYLQAYLASFMLENHCHPIIDVSLIITPHFLGGSILSTCSPFVRGGFIYLTCSSFPRRVHIFDLFFLSEESLYLWLVLPFWREFVSSTCSSFLKRVHIFDFIFLS